MKECNGIIEGETKEIKTYLEILRSLSESTDDYLFLCELKKVRGWFVGKISDRYNLLNDGEPYCGLEEWASVIYPKDIPAVLENLMQVKEGKSMVHNMEYRLMDRRGNRVWISCRGTVQKDEMGRPFVMIGRVSDQALRYKVDALTGLFNQVKMSEDMEHIFPVNTEGFLMILGVDNLKVVNIKHGREYGNQMLKNVAKILEDLVGYSRYLYRLDGDCFAIYMPQAKPIEVQNIYEQIKVAVAPECTLSAGAASFEMAIKDGGLLYQYAEIALDKAKKAGKNTLVFFASDDYNEQVSVIELYEQLEDSVQNHFEGFELFYQPQMKAGNYRLFGAEALLRYHSSTRGQVMPSEFIPILEQSDLIYPVGMWVLKTALKQCKKWREWIPDFHISVNMSYAQLKYENIMEDVLEALKVSGVPGEALTLEVTESMQLQNFPYYNEIFSKWKAVGIGISVDDFGTGYSSLGYLKNLMIDEIKIDRCFVSGIQYSSYNYGLLSNMLKLAAASQIRVCCEGVEKEEELQVLEELRTDLLQGYLFSKPCDIKAFEKMFFKHENIEYEERLKHMVQIKKGNARKLLNLKHRDILKETNLGLWVIRINEESNCYEMYADETMHRIMGADRNLLPEECYQYWYHHINEGYYNYVNKSVEEMISSGKIVQLQYTWSHPVMGDVQVRCTGVRIEDSDGMICLEGYHRIINNINQMEILEELPSKEEFEFNESKRTIYFHTSRHLLQGEALHEHNFPQCWIEAQIVHPHFADYFCELFQSIQSKNDVKDVELMLQSKQGEYTWFKMNIRHLSEEINDRHTIVVQLYAANQERSMELENRRIRDFYKASLSEAIAYAELDIESGYIQATGGLWAENGQNYNGQADKFLQYIINRQNEYGFYESTEKYDICSSVAELKSKIQEGEATQRFTYIRKIKHQWHWVELVIHTFKEQFSKNMYALLYLKDVDAQKKHEIEQRKAASTDALTMVYNRKTFEEEVQKFLYGSSKERKGILMLIDVDDFKSVNDKKGHQAGDDVLKHVAQCLESTFDKDGIVGRFGGDEFLVFAKGEISKEAFNQRIEAFFSSLKHSDFVEISCSVGMDQVDSRQFSYETSLGRVDKALYWSKKNGKNQYHWAETVAER